MAIYLASNKELPASEFVPDKTFFCLKKDDGKDLGKNLSLMYKYYCGSHSECGCGFCFDYDDQDNDDDKNKNDWGKQSVAELFGFLKANFGDVKYFEIFSCWEGDEEMEIESRKEIDLAKFELGRAFSFAEKEVIKVIDSSKRFT